MDRPDSGAWYDQNQARYQDLINTLEQLLTTLLKEESIPYHSVGGRLKAKDSFLSKLDRKAYTAPEQVMDVAGLRVITHTTEEVKRVCALIESEFLIDDTNSGDKAQDMGVDEVGYLSVHYIARMSSDRLGLKEYQRFAGVCFEIQVRSLLQHAWAEIEHDRGYKFAGVLPQEIQRKFYLVAGTLELMDQEFTALSREIDHYAQQVKEQAEKGELDIPIDSTSLLQFLEEYFKGCDLEQLSCTYSSGDAEIIAELLDFGLYKLQDVAALLNQKPTDEWVADSSVTYLGILRAAMILKDMRKYFECAWKEHWVGLAYSSLERWENLGIDRKCLEQFVTLEKDNPHFLTLARRSSS